MKKIILILSALLLTAVTSYADFSDMEKHMWANDAVNELAEKGIINGVSETEFMPGGNVTYEQLAKLLATSFELKVPEIPDGGRWSDGYIEATRKYFMFTNEYDYDTPLQRVEVVSAIGKLYAEGSGLSAVYTEPFNDAELLETVPEIEPEYILTAKTVGITTGDTEGNFRPFDNVTRAECAVLFQRLINLKTEDIKMEHTKVLITMDNGDTIKVELMPEYAPETVANFVSLVKEGFYDGLTFHRVISGFMIQGGDPLGNGMGGSDKKIKGEFASNGFVQNTLKHERGVISMARSQMPDSASSQFFIMHEDAPYLDGQYAAFGKVIEGIEAVDRIAAEKTDMMDKPLTPVVIESIVIAE